MGVVGSGPAGLAVAAELNKLGHSVTVYERDEGAGGLLRFGVPDAKLEKWIIDRRVALLEDEGIVFEYGADVGGDVDADELRRRHDAVILAIGSRVHRDLDVPGPRVRGRALRDGLPLPAQPLGGRLRGPRGAHDARPAVISAAGKKVVVVGGGDTGMDCMSNALREGAADVLMLDVYPPLPARGRPPTHAVAAAAQAHAQHLRPGRGRQPPLRHGGHRLLGATPGTWPPCAAGAWRAPRRATCAPCRAATSWSPPSSC